MAEAPQLGHTEIHEQLENLSRRPFRALLARILACAPSDEAIQALAERSPDRWGQFLSLASKPAGYNDKLEVEGSIALKINDLSDAELLAQISANRAVLDMQSSERAPNGGLDTGAA